MKKITILTLLIALCLTSPVYAKTEPPTIQSKAAILMNANNGKILYSHKENDVFDAASLTKIMSLHLGFDAISKGDMKEDELITASRKANNTGGSKMWIEAGQTYPAIEILKGITIVSGNDASVALAEHMSGSTEAFVTEMNQKAKELGMDQTNFITPHGLGEDKTTASDLSKLAYSYISHHSDRLAIHSEAQYSTKDRLVGEIVQYNQNPLIINKYEGADGLKTGFINGLFNFVGTAKRDGLRLIVVTLGAENASARYQDATRLLNYGFNQYETVSFGTQGDPVVDLTVYKAKDSLATNVVLESDLSLVAHVDDVDQIEVTDDVPDFITAPREIGEVIGKRIVKLGDETYTANIVMTENLEKAGFWRSIFDTVSMVFAKILSFIFG
ncbi:D-alanyl-D-alanine carboxypeptidase (plasmid) [Pontibacillus sp. ALD_SL1]|uniref:D-alanyl-D-alanine carboxypeptidase family protein n=1 Tax=Pontibacillus sp. ALD_SL1 TaxID=2777185 RepID=UPI001A971101|nr:D-alanyl-D-alanine carboxypeptidase family protein [Pontibacillus sp. ALD_SL1]QST02966.1 D-alanyl-D-alanine carboxypeptidase [Pontibacillus sp. ALD_SL1]